MARDPGVSPLYFLNLECFLMLASLDQSMIDALLADSRFTSRFPDLAEARARLARVGQGQTPTGGCCGGSVVPSQQANGLRNVFSWLKKTIATWPQATKSEFLATIGQHHLQIAYNDNGVVKVVTISR